jgi:hypothetical protein
MKKLPGLMMFEMSALDFYIKCRIFVDVAAAIGGADAERIPFHR